MKKVLIYFLAILIGFESVFITFRVGGISYDRLILLLLFFCLFLSYLKDYSSIIFLKRLSNFFLLFLLLKLFSNLYLNLSVQYDFTVTIKDMVKQFNYIAYAYMLFLIYSSVNIRAIKVITCIQISICLFGILIHPLSPISSQLFVFKEFLFANAPEEFAAKAVSDELAYVEGGYAERTRLSGPFRSSIRFSYFAFSAFCFNLFWFYRNKGKFFLIAVFLILICSLLSQTRSLLLGEFLVICGFLYAKFQNRNYLQKGVFAGLMFLLGLGIFTISKGFVFESASKSTETSRLSSVSAKGDSRPYLWFSGIYTAFRFPFGSDITQKEMAKHEAYLITGSEDILYLPPHNGVINIGTNFTVFGYLGFLALITWLVSYLKDRDYKDKILFISFYLGYLAQISFHNEVILLTDYFIVNVIMLNVLLPKSKE